METIETVNFELYLYSYYDSDEKKSIVVVQVDHPDSIKYIPPVKKEGYEITINFFNNKNGTQSLEETHKSISYTAPHIPVGKDVTVIAKYFDKVYNGNIPNTAATLSKKKRIRLADAEMPGPVSK